MGRLTAVGYDWVYRNEYIPLAEQIETLFAVTADQVTDVVRKHDLEKDHARGPRARWRSWTVRPPP